MNNVTEIKTLSHASFLMGYSDKRIMMNPWLIVSCYWRSWWNYPLVERDLVDDLKVDAIYITYVHWDHWHAPSLKKLFNAVCMSCQLLDLLRLVKQQLDSDQ
jgi:L-ascorbate metabolism protein UlaG (beta-lactamase superfamily)